MINLEPKKLLILRILQILTERTDGEHRLRQAEIQEILRKEFYIDIDRRTVRRNIEFLQEAGYDIVLERQGAYLACRNFEVGELRLLIDSVLANRNVCSAHTKDLVEKLVQQGGKYFKNYAKHVINLDDWQKQDSQDYFYNIELFCEAIEKKKQVSFFYNNFGIDKKLHHKKGDKRVVNPYQMLLKNGFYYLLCNYDGYENSVFCRVDKVSEVEVLETNAKPHTQVKGLENGLNVGRISNRLPYMFEGSVEEIVF
ncbi:MAG: WYL domain-containing protein, partial [Clostridia bacterium]|nr:WYL domain-containing protein [Clostridia bacterium]